MGSTETVHAPTKDGIKTLDLHHIGGLQTLGTCVDCKFNQLAFFQRFKAGFLNSCVVDENVITRGTLNKTEPLGIAEPFYGSLFFHTFFLPFT
jgi:hypothetical protein